MPGEGGFKKKPVVPEGGDKNESTAFKDETDQIPDISGLLEKAKKVVKAVKKNQQEQQVKPTPPRRCSCW